MVFDFFLFRTLRAKVIGLVVSIVVFISIVTFLIMQGEFVKTFSASNDNHSQNMVNYLLSSVSTQYKSIEFHEQAVMNLRKENLREHVEIAIQIIEKYHAKVAHGIMSERQAKHKAANEIKNIRYDDGIGYFWINDIQQPFPSMIMHPTMPELDGNILDDERFNCALGKDVNLFVTAVDVCLNEGSGFVDYYWPKPTDQGLTTEQPKLSYVEMFKPWGWIVGSGIYIDEVEKEIKARANAVIQELNEELGSLKTLNEGYAFIMNGNAKMLVHPYLSNPQLVQLLEGEAVDELLHQIIGTYKAGNSYIDYTWIGVEDTVNFFHPKRAYVTYFEPLDWYIVASYYLQQIEKPINNLRRKTIIFSLIVLMLAIVVSIFLARTITRPIQELSRQVMKIKEEGVFNSIDEIKGGFEIVNFRHLLNTMINSLKASQEEIILNQKKLQQYLEYAPDPVFIINKESVILNCNIKGQHLFKRDSFELLGHEFTDLAGNNGRERLEQFVVNIVDKGLAEEEILITGTDGQKTSILASGTLLNSGEIILFVKNIDNIKQYQNELFKAKQKAEESNRLKSAFLANMSHEIRTPMNGVVGFTQLIVDPELPDDERISYAEIINSSSMQLLRIVNDIVDISKIEAGLITLDCVPIVLVDFFNELKVVYSQQCADLNLKIDINVPKENSDLLNNDYTKIRQIFDNLISNALKFTNKGGIELGYVHESGIFKFWVADTGVGLSENDQNIIFDRFTQAKESGSNGKGGTGLGLAISKAYVDLMKGKIWVKSELNKGSAFYFTIPNC